MIPTYTPADAARHVSQASGFMVSIFVRDDLLTQIETKTFAAALMQADSLLAQHPTCTRGPRIYAIMPVGNSELIDYTDPAVLAAIGERG